jgi:hypothetical protein
VRRTGKVDDMLPVPRQERRAKRNRLALVF